MAIPEKTRMSLLRIKSLSEEFLDEAVSEEKVSQFETVTKTLLEENLPTLLQWLQKRREKANMVLQLKEQVKVSLVNVDLPIDVYKKEEDVVILQLDTRGGYAIRLLRNPSQDLELYYSVNPAAYGWEDSYTLEVVNDQILQYKLNEEQLDQLVDKLKAILKNPEIVDYYFWENRLINNSLGHPKYDIQQFGLRLIKLQGEWCKEYLWKSGNDENENTKKIWKMGIHIEQVNDRHGKVRYFAFHGKTEKMRVFQTTFLPQFSDQVTIFLGLYKWGGEEEQRWKDIKTFMKLRITDRSDLLFDGQNIATLEKRYDVAIEVTDKTHGHYLISISGPEDNVLTFENDIIKPNEKIRWSGLSLGSRPILSL